MSKIHKMKIWPEYFWPVYRWEKKAEVRLDDRGFKVGDTLLLQEFDPKKKRYTGLEVQRKISHLADLSPFFKKPFVLLSFHHRAMSLVEVARQEGVIPSGFIPCDCGHWLCPGWKAKRVKKRK